MNVFVKCYFIVCLSIASAIAIEAQSANNTNTQYPYTYKKGDYQTIIPKKPQRIVFAGGIWPLPSLIIALENSADSLLYVPTASKLPLKHSILGELYPQALQTNAGENTNVEELLSYKPDLFICPQFNMKICDLLRKTSIPTIEISVKDWDYNVYDTLKGWLEIIAPILDKKQKALDFLNIAKEVEQEIAQKVAKEKGKKPKVLIIHNFEEGKIINAAGLFGHYWLQKSGAENVIKSKTNARVSLEDIYKLNPDIIYLNNFSTLLPQDILDSKLWQPIKAVKDKRVYKFPFGTYRPFAPSLDMPVLLKWLFIHNYQQNLDMKELKAWSKDFYKNILGLDLSQSQVEAIFTPNANRGRLK